MKGVEIAIAVSTRVVRVLLGLVWATRPLPSSIAAAAAFVGWSWGHSSRTPESAMMLCGSMFLLTGAGFAWNDYFDRDLDRVNMSHRPIPSGMIEGWMSVAWGACCFTGALALSVRFGAGAVIYCVVATLGMVVYTPWLKRYWVLKNVYTGIHYGSAVLFGALASGAPWRGAIMAGVVAIPALAAREVLMDVRDAAGDRRIGLRTAPVVYGTKQARIGAAIVLLVWVVCAGLYLGQLTSRPAAMGLLAVALAGVVLAALLVLAGRTEQQLRYWRSTQLILAALALGIVVLWMSH